jgi:hypothetical protein
VSGNRLLSLSEKTTGRLERFCCLVKLLPVYGTDSITAVTNRLPAKRQGFFSGFILGREFLLYMLGN